MLQDSYQLRSWRSSPSQKWFFLLQAEDGIRDHCVTGVQTCALPISAPGGAGTGHLVRGAAGSADRPREIGRASCRERGVDLGGRRIIKKKKKMRQRRLRGRWVTHRGCVGQMELVHG